MAKRRRGRDDMTSSHVYVLRDFLGRLVEHPRMLPASEVQFRGCEEIGEDATAPTDKRGFVRRARA